MPLLKDTEWRLLCIIARQTLGWQDGTSGRRKTSDWLSQRQLRERTGRDAAALSRAITVLIAQHLIVVQDGHGEPLNTARQRHAARSCVYYGLHPAVLTRIQQGRYNDVAKSGLVSPQKSTATGYFGERNTPFWRVESPKANRTKETVTKEIETKENLQNVVFGNPNEGLKNLNRTPETLNEDSEKLNAVAVLATEVFVPQVALSTRLGSGEARGAEDDHAELRTAPFIALYQERFRHHLGAEPPLITQEDGDRLQSLMEKESFEFLTKLLEAFFTTDLSHIQRQGYSLPAFLHSIYLLKTARWRP